MCSNRSTVKVHTQPRSPKDHACDVVNYLSSVLFPPGISNAPIEQLQQFYGAAVANRMVSANDIDKRNLANSAAPSDSGMYVCCILYPRTIVFRAVQDRRPCGHLGHTATPLLSVEGH